MKLFSKNEGSNAAHGGTRTAKGGIILGIRAQLMLFFATTTVVTLCAVWFAITYLLQPQYNQTIHDTLAERASAIVGMIDASEEPISSRTFGYLTHNQEFWDNLNEMFDSGVINVNNCCVDISDTTYRNVQYRESIYPCLLHKSIGGLGGNYEITADSTVVVRLRHMLFEQGTLYEIVESGGTRQMMVGQLSADGQYAVIVSTNLAQIAVASGVLADILPPIALLLLLVNLFAAFLFSRSFSKPIVELSAGAREIADGNYDTRVNVRRNDEIGLLAEEFNHMAGEVKRAYQLEADILANVSHDLRTPLTLIKGYAETVRDITGDDPQKRSEQCNIIVDESDRLSTLVNSVMELSKVSSGAERPNLVAFDMGQLCFEVAGRYDDLCDKNGWRLQLEADAACPVSADPAMMERVLHNLLGNAFHHIGADGLVILRAIPQPGGCRVEVADHGPGIAPEDLPYIFDRYYRARKDAGKTGTGLGLSITKAILQQHGFAFGVNSELGKGSTFWFEAGDGRLKQAKLNP